MLKKRIIPCLDIKAGRAVKGVNFVDIRDAGDPVELAKRYVEFGADELVFLDISATQEKRKTLTELVSEISKSINIPFTVGGGVNSLIDAKRLVDAGADKVSLNSAAVKTPELITEIAGNFGSQCVVVAIDVKLVEEKWKVFISGGDTETELEAVDWAKLAEEMRAGEILLTSMYHDGTRNGFALDITESICQAVNIPVIASGGAGAEHDFESLFECTSASAGLAASIFHYNILPIPQLKTHLKQANIPVRI